MVVKIADNIISPLGIGTAENYEAVKSGATSLRKYERKWGLPEPFVASFFDDDVLDSLCSAVGVGSDFTRFERMAIAAAAGALGHTDIDVASPDTMFVLASTKGNVHLLAGMEDGRTDDSRLSLYATAVRIAAWFGNSTPPLVVCNACISGLNAQIEAVRMLKSGMAKTVVVLALDMLSPFIVSGFQTFRSVSDEPCRPFDEDRIGLNLGEAAACAVFQQKSPDELKPSDWIVGEGAICNDAYHISHPSRTAEGGTSVLKAAMHGISPEQITMVNVHGTATMFNDEMEAIALDRAGLGEVPVNTLKGYYGHTLGAAGLLETIITMSALDDGTILATKGFSSLGVSRNVNISAVNRQTNGKRFIKLISGFGGCNAAVRFETFGECVRYTM